MKAKATVWSVGLLQVYFLLEIYHLILYALGKLGMKGIIAEGIDALASILAFSVLGCPTRYLYFYGPLIFALSLSIFSQYKH